MKDISKVSKLKVQDYSEEIKEAANTKCTEARQLLKKAYLADDSRKFFLEAVDRYIEAIAIYPRLTEPYLAIAEICRLFGELEQATGLLNKVLDIEPKNPNALSMQEKIIDDFNNKNKSAQTAKVPGKYLSQK